MSNKTIVGLGEILWDIFPDKQVLGGAPANFAYHISQLGYDGCIVSAIGGDYLGEEILSVLSEKDVDYVIDKVVYPTGTVEVKLDEAGVPQYEIHEGSAWDNIIFTPRIEKIARKSRAVCFGSLAQRSIISRETIRKFLITMPPKSLKIFDANLRQHFYSQKLISNSLELSDILKVNDEELTIIRNLFALKESSEEDICRLLLKNYNLKMVILTKGVSGSFVFTPEEVSYQPTPEVHVADTVGAGDAFTAAFIAAYLNGNAIKDAHQLAAEVSAYVCTQHGAMPQLPDVYKELFKK